LIEYYITRNMISNNRVHTRIIQSEFQKQSSLTWFKLIRHRSRI